MFQENMRQLIGETVVMVQDELVITWNGNTKFHVYDNELETIDCFTCNDVKTLSGAIDIAIDFWHGGRQQRG